jgi:hypothetical protein
MEPSADGPPVVPVPERIDRRLRLGPFASARDALKFLAYAAVGAVLAPIVSPWLGVGFVAIGFGVAVYRPDGLALDERCLAYTHWQFRSARGELPMTSEARATASPRLLSLSTGERVAIVRANGVPTAYLPPAELVRRFERFRELLRTVRDGLAFSVALAPMRSEPVVPPSVPEGRRDSAAAAGYAQLVTLLCARRWVRRIDLVLRSTGTGAEGIADLESRAAGLVDRLGSLGVDPVRLQGRALSDAARRWGWSARRSSP